MRTKSIGEHFSLGLVVTKLDGTTLVDLSDDGWEIYFGIFPSAKAGDWSSAIVQKTIAGGGITKTDPANGACRIDVEDTDTYQKDPGTYYVFIKAISPLGKEEDVIKGQKLKLAYSPLKDLEPA